MDARHVNSTYWIFDRRRRAAFPCRTAIDEYALCWVLPTLFFHNVVLQSGQILWSCVPYSTLCTLRPMQGLER